MALPTADEMSREDLSLVKEWEDFQDAIKLPEDPERAEEQLLQAKAVFYAGAGSTMKIMAILNTNLLGLTPDEKKTVISNMMRDILDVREELTKKFGGDINHEGETEEDGSPSLTCILCGSFAVTVKGIIRHETLGRTLTLCLKCWTDHFPQKTPTYYMGETPKTPHGEEHAPAR